MQLINFKKTFPFLFVFILTSCASKYEAINHYISQRGNDSKYITSDKIGNSETIRQLKQCLLTDATVSNKNDTICTKERWELFNKKYGIEKKSTIWEYKDFKQNNIQIINSEVLWSNEKIMKSEPNLIEVYSFSDQMQYGDYTVFSFQIYLFPIRTYIANGVIIMKETNKKWQVVDTIPDDMILH